jgi:ABC-type transport system involved in multi-copper enzyme maturation permease subunit
MSRLRTIRLVAGFDLHDSLRSRKAIALLLLYLIVALAGSAIFASWFNLAWEKLTERFGAEGSEKLLASDELAQFVAETLRIGKDLAKELLAVPPLALWYLALATNAMPLVVVLTSSDAISSELSSGSVRYALFRTDRLSWALGKLLGQAALMTIGVFLGAVGAFLLGAAMLDRFDALSNALWLLQMSGRATVYGFSYLGVALCVSQLVRGNGAARGLGLVLVIVLAAGGSMLGGLVERGAPTIVDVIRQAFPNAHGSALFMPDLADRVPAMIALVIIGLGFFAIGHLRFARRDA